MKISVASSLVFIALFGCGSSQSGATSAGGASSGGQASARFSFAEGAIEPDTSAERPALALMLAADGSVRSTREALGRFEANRYVLPAGAELFHVEQDGRVVIPWRQQAPEVVMRYTAEGLEVTLPDGTNTLTIDASGVFHAGANPGGGRFAPYTPALRDTALMLRFLPLLVLKHGLSSVPPLTPVDATVTVPANEPVTTPSTTPSN